MTAQIRYFLIARTTDNGSHIPAGIVKAGTRLAGDMAFNAMYPVHTRVREQVLAACREIRLNTALDGITASYYDIPVKGNSPHTVRIAPIR